MIYYMYIKIYYCGVTAQLRKSKIHAAALTVLGLSTQIRGFPVLSGLLDYYFENLSYS